jgi:hypothetical protein
MAVGVTAYESIDEMAGVTVPPVHLDLTVASVTRALAGAGTSRWRLMLKRLTR